MQNRFDFLMCFNMKHSMQVFGNQFLWRNNECVMELICRMTDISESMERFYHVNWIVTDMLTLFRCSLNYWIMIKYYHLIYITLYTTSNMLFALCFMPCFLVCVCVCLGVNVSFVRHFPKWAFELNKWLLVDYFIMHFNFIHTHELLTIRQWND